MLYCKAKFKNEEYRKESILNLTLSVRLNPITFTDKPKK